MDMEIDENRCGINFAYLHECIMIIVVMDVTYFINGRVISFAT